MRRLCAWLVVLTLAMGGLCQASMAAAPVGDCAPQLNGHGQVDHDGAGHAGMPHAQGHRPCCPNGCLPGSLVPPGLAEHALAWRSAELASRPPPDRPDVTPTCPLRPPNRSL